MMARDKEKIAEDYFAAMDTVAVDVVTSNKIDPDWGASNADLAHTACKLMNWDDFDLFATLDFEGVYKSDDLPSIHAYAILAHLRGCVFREANARNMGIDKTNEFAASHSEFWEAKLTTKWKALRRGETPQHRWVN